MHSDRATWQLTQSIVADVWMAGSSMRAAARSRVSWLGGRRQDRSASSSIRDVAAPQGPRAGSAGPRPVPEQDRASRFNAFCPDRHLVPDEVRVASSSLTPTTWIRLPKPCQITGQLTEGRHCTHDQTRPKQQTNSVRTRSARGRDDRDVPVSMIAISEMSHASHLLGTKLRAPVPGAAASSAGAVRMVVVPAARETSSMEAARGPRRHRPHRRQ